MSRINSPFPILRATANLLTSHKKILYPSLFLLFVNLLVLEFLYFIPHFPLKIFFGPLIEKIWGESYLYYPLDLVLLPKLFYYAQMVVYFAIGSFLLGVTVHMVNAANNEERLSFKNSVTKTLPVYLNIFLASVVSFILFQVVNFFLGLLVFRAGSITSVSPLAVGIKKLIIVGAPYVQFIFGLLVTIILAYLTPVIVLERKKIAQSIALNLKTLFSSFWLTVTIVVIPTIFYLPILLIRNNIGVLVYKTIPEVQIAVIALSVIATVIINMFIMTSTTLFYLYKKDMQ